MLIANLSERCWHVTDGELRKRQYEMRSIVGRGNDQRMLVLL
jgi:hypothetical protein